MKTVVVVYFFYTHHAFNCTPIFSMCSNVSEITWLKVDPAYLDLSPTFGDSQSAPSEH